MWLTRIEQELDKWITCLRTKMLCRILALIAIVLVVVVLAFANDIYNAIVAFFS